MSAGSRLFNRYSSIAFSNRLKIGNRVNSAKLAARNGTMDSMVVNVRLPATWARRSSLCAADGESSQAEHASLIVPGVPDDSHVGGNSNVTRCFHWISKRAITVNTVRLPGLCEAGIWLCIRPRDRQHWVGTNRSRPSMCALKPDCQIERHGTGRSQRPATGNQQSVPNDS